MQERRAQRERVIQNCLNWKESDSKLFELERERERGRFKILFFSFLILGRDISVIIYFGDIKKIKNKKELKGG